MDDLQLERVSLVGISLGGGAALGFTFYSPRRVERLVLVDSYGLEDEVPWGRLGYLLAHAPLGDTLIYTLLCRRRRMFRRSLYNLIHYRRVVTEEMVEEIYRLVNKPETGCVFSSFHKNEVRWSGLHTSFAARLHEIKVLVPIIHGENDSLVPLPGRAGRISAPLTQSDACFPVADICRHVSTRRSPTG